MKLYQTIKQYLDKLKKINGEIQAELFLRM